MSIYSANRSGSFVFAAAGNYYAEGEYTDTDFGRILYESQINDMAIFEGVLKSDFAQIKGLQEGTLLETEAIKFERKSAGEILKALGERIKKFWEKIKSAFKAAVRKIAAYILKDGKAFVQDFKALVAKYKVNTSKLKAVDARVPKDADFSDIQIPSLDSIQRKIESDKDNADVLKTKDIVKEFLGADSPKDYTDNAVKEHFEERKVGSGEIDSMCKFLENASATIKALKKAEKDAENAVKTLSKKLKDAERELNKDDGKARNHVIKNINVLVSASEVVISTISGTKIKCVKNTVAAYRKVLTEFRSQIKGDPEAVKEAAVVDAGEEVKTALDQPVEVVTNEDPEVIEAIDAVENEVEPEVASEVEAECKNC